MGIEASVNGERIGKSPEGAANSDHLGGMLRDRVLSLRSEVVKHPGLSMAIITVVIVATRIMIGANPEFNLVAADMDQVIDSGFIDAVVSPGGEAVDPDLVVYDGRLDDPGPHGDAWSSGNEAGGALKQETLVDSKIGAETAVSDKPSVPPASLGDQINTGRDDLYDFNPRKIPDNPLATLQDIDRGQQGEIEPPYDLEKRTDVGFGGGEEEVEMAGGAPDEPAERTITRETIKTGASETPETAKLGRVIASDMVETSSVVGKEPLKPFEMGDVVQGETPKTVEMGEVVKGHQPKTVEMGESSDAGGHGSSKIARIGKLFNKIKGS